MVDFPKDLLVVPSPSISNLTVKKCGRPKKSYVESSDYTKTIIKCEFDSFTTPAAVSSI